MRRRILHLNAGNETGGGMHHIVSLLNEFSREEFVLGVLEKGELEKRAKALHINTVHFSKKRFPLASLRQIKKYMQQENIHIIHSHGPRANVFANALRRRANFRWIVTMHSNPQHDFSGKGIRGKLLEQLHMHALRRADRIILVSEDLRKKMALRGLDKNRMITARNGIDFKEKITMQVQKEDFGIGENDFIFLMVARLVPVKDHALALRAFAKVCKLRGGCHLLLAGDGQEKDRLQRLTEQLGIASFVHFLGEREDVHALYKLANITLLTSKSEGFPLVLLESARAKTPAIATNVGVIAEIIPDAAHGWVVTAGDAASICEAMQEAIIFEEQGRLQSMGEKFYQHASHHFSVEKFANKIYNVYNTM
ncbi:glycosyltransferase [Virgibacillus sp. 179-BFC.A HS]|uniref:Glycosyltransferase n=1 Tax=Tigheibacillus jepli TaxID=3035914 RepID=A0ABU5CET7_9BACI|nr:glycosyltransferase [Virgibacillus sp. 179-BFC.A HS]MDY0404735.1 glycosyltransferase [Virgibacillus sp. 179-BFC.A HS]